MVLICLRRVWFLLFCFFACSYGNAQSVRLNELLASNHTGHTDAEGDADDWIELYNSDSIAVDLAGYFISDNVNKPYKWQIPAGSASSTTIEAGGFLLLWADDEQEEGATHLPFKLDAAGEHVLLTSPDSVLLDWIGFGQQTTDVSLARLPDGTGDWILCTVPTPNVSNGSSSGAPLTDTPIASVSSGRFSQAIQVHFTSTTPGAEIRLTFDGTVPDESDSLFTQPIDIQSTAVVRARAFAPEYLPGLSSTNSYLFIPKHTFPVISLVFNPVDFFDTLTGIYTQAIEFTNVEVPVHATWLEPDGSVGFEADLAVETFGNGSLTLPQKSLLLKAKSAFGAQEIEYQVFPDLPQDEYKSIVLRNSGQDWGVTMFRDALVGSLARDIKDVEPMTGTLPLAFQSFKPSVVYLNGQYWGIHNVREQQNKSFIGRHFDVDTDSIDYIEFYGTALEGDSVEWQDFWQWVTNEHFESDQKFNELAQKNDMANFTDYCVFQIVADNVDWPGKNWRRFKSHEAGARWQWIPYDFDLSFGLMTTDFAWNTGFAGQNAFARALDSLSSFWATADWQTVILRRALENQHYRQYFLNRTADLLNTVFEKGRVLTRIDSFRNMYLPEIDRHFERWYFSPGWIPYWEENLHRMSQFAEMRPDFCFDHVLETFPEAQGVANVSLAVEPPGAGKLEWSTLQFDSTHLPWHGRYFNGIPIPVQATAQPGWSFAGWSAPDWGNADSLSILLNGDLQLTAYFVQDSVPLDTEEAVVFFRLMPNPAGRTMQIASEQPFQQVAFYDVLGIRRKTLHFDNVQSAPLALDELPAGVYWAEVTFGTGQKGWKRFVRN